MSTTTIDKMTARAVYSCPNWCSRPDHDADVLSLPSDLGNVYHYGPDFGCFGVSGTSLDDLAGIITRFNDTDEFTATQLRELAADALAAAEWLEARL